MKPQHLSTLNQHVLASAAPALPALSFSIPGVCGPPTSTAAVPSDGLVAVGRQLPYTVMGRPLVASCVCFSRGAYPGGPGRPPRTSVNQGHFHSQSGDRERAANSTSQHFELLYKHDGVNYRHLHPPNRCPALLCRRCLHTYTDADEEGKLHVTADCPLGKRSGQGGDVTIGPFDILMRGGPDPTLLRRLEELHGLLPLQQRDEENHDVRATLACCADENTGNMQKVIPDVRETQRQPLSSQVIQRHLDISESATPAGRKSKAKKKRSGKKRPTKKFV